MVVSWRILIRVAVAGVVLLAIAFALGNHQHGFLAAVTTVVWIGALLSLPLLIVLGVVFLVQSRRPRAS